MMLNTALCIYSPFVLFSENCLLNLPIYELDHFFLLVFNYLNFLYLLDFNTLSVE
jgi:hypothetical protein